MPLASSSTLSQLPSHLLESLSWVLNLFSSLSGLNLSRMVFFKLGYICVCSPDRASNMAQAQPHRRVGSFRSFFSSSVQISNRLNQDLTSSSWRGSGRANPTPDTIFLGFGTRVLMSTERFSLKLNQTIRDMCLAKTGYIIKKKGPARGISHM